MVENASPLTDSTYWDRHWEEHKPPMLVARHPNDVVLNAQLDLMDFYIKNDMPKTILEIGGAPGQYLAYFAKTHHCEAALLDFSPVGCQETRKNFERAGINVEIIEADLFTVNPDNRFDVVYSLGVVEHFENLGMTLEKHLAFVKPGGILIIGVPNFMRAYAPVFKIFAPVTLSKHNLGTLDISKWNMFEQKYQLQALFKGHLGGMEPALLSTVITPELSNFHGIKKLIGKLACRSINLYTKIRRVIWKIMPAAKRLRNINSSAWSAYAIVIYRTPNI